MNIPCFQPKMNFVPEVDPQYKAYAITNKTRYIEMFLVVDNAIVSNIYYSDKLEFVLMGWFQPTCLACSISSLGFSVAILLGFEILSIKATEEMVRARHAA